VIVGRTQRYAASPAIATRPLPANTAAFSGSDSTSTVNVTRVDQVSRVFGDVIDVSRDRSRDERREQGERGNGDRSGTNGHTPSTSRTYLTVFPHGRSGATLKRSIPPSVYDWQIS